MRKLKVVILIILLSVFILNQSCSQNKSIKVGVIISSTGSGSHMTETLDGIKFAASEINKWGGINGREVELLIRDNETDPQKAIDIFKELEKEFSPELYICALSAISDSLAPLAEEYRAPLLCLVTANTEVTMDRRWIFRFYTTAEGEIPPILNFIEKLNIKKLSVLFRNDSYGSSVLNYLIEKNKFSGINIGSAAFDTKTAEISGALDLIENSDALYIVGYATEISKILKQLRMLDYKGYILCSSGATQFENRNTPEANGIFTAAPYIYNKNYPFASELKKNFENEFNRPLNHYGANGYEALKIFASLMSNMEINRENIRTALSGGFVYAGALGEISVISGSHDFNFELIPAIIKDGSVLYE